MSEFKTIAVSSGHGRFVPGATPPYLNEVTEARKVAVRLVQELKARGCVVHGPYNDDVSHSQNENLNRIVDWHNAQARDLDISVHFNSNVPTSHPVGTECLYVSQQELAADVAAAVADAGQLKDRGPKKRTDLFFLNNTEEPAILVEVCFVDSKADSDLYKKNFNAICAAMAGAVAGNGVQPGPGPDPGPGPGPTPPTPPSGGHPELRKGDDGPAVVELQRKLGVLVPDGNFGSITDTWVRAFQGAASLGVDGVVGPKTWAEVDHLAQRVKAGEHLLAPGLVDQIITMAQTSEIADFSWPDRGIPPPGYISGMALSFAHALRLGGNDVTEVMSMAAGNPDKDALAWYAPEFKKLGMSNSQPGWDTMRHLFTMMIGLGPRESSGRYCEGRDLSASNVQSDTAEAGLFQTSWNIRGGSSAIEPLIDEFWQNPNGYLPAFKEQVTATANNLNSYGSGDGVRYQFLSRFAPLFHVLVTGVGMRTLRQHWGPINRREVLLKHEADDLLKDVQELVQSTA